MIVVVDRRERTFRVNCTSTGGRALNMSVTGPGASFLSSIQAVGDPQGMGNDMFSVSTNVIQGRLDGDAYLCSASNGVSPDLNNSLELRGIAINIIPCLPCYNIMYWVSIYHPVASAPNITSLDQISATAVRVEWSQPSGGATVTGYVVHYSDGDTDRTESVAANSTSYNIRDLTSGLTYTISVEATSEHLSGVSDNVMTSLG